MMGALPLRERLVSRRSDAEAVRRVEDGEDEDGGEHQEQQQRGSDVPLHHGVPLAAAAAQQPWARGRRGRKWHHAALLDHKPELDFRSIPALDLKDVWAFSLPLYY